MLINQGMVDEYIKQIHNPKDLADVHYNLGNTYCRRFADIQKSNYHYQKALKLFRENNEKKREIDCLRDLTVNKELVGDYEAAHQGFLRCAELSRDHYYYTGFTSAIGGIVLLYLHQHELDKLRAPWIKEYIEDFYNETADLQIKETLELYEALKGNNSSLLKDQVKAQLILEDLSKNSKYSQNRWSAKHMLVLNYIKEMNYTKNLDLHVKSRELIDSLLPSAKTNFILQIRLKILNAKLYMISGDLYQTQNNLEQVLETIKELTSSYVIKRFVDEVEYEIEEIKKQYNEWTNLIQINQDLGERMENEDLMQYLSKAQQVLEQELTKNE